MDKTDAEALLEFPCHYQFKAMGLAGECFKDAIIAAVDKYVTVPADAVRCRQSGKGTYQSVSVLVTLHNYKQLTDIYAGIRQVEDLKMLL